MNRKRVLVVEDEMLLAMTLEDVLTDMGCEAVGPAMHLDDALRLAQTERLDLAILDINLGGKARSDAVARLLKERSVPFVFMSGYGDAGLGAEFSGEKIIAKPASPEIIEAAVRNALS